MRKVALSARSPGREPSSEKRQDSAHRVGAERPHSSLGRKGSAFVNSQALMKADVSSARNLCHSQDGGGLRCRWGWWGAPSSLARGLGWSASPSEQLNWVIQLTSPWSLLLRTRGERAGEASRMRPPEIRLSPAFMSWGLSICSVNDKRLCGLWAGGGADWGCPGGEGCAPLLGPSVGCHCHRPGPALWPSGQGLGASPDRPSVLFPLLSCCPAGAFSGRS